MDVISQTHFNLTGPAALIYREGVRATELVQQVAGSNSDELK
jgi:hypothetical protein